MSGVVTKRATARIVVSDVAPSYIPGSDLDCVIRVEPSPGAAVKQIDARVQWSTCGKGNRDCGSIFQDRIELAPSDQSLVKTLRLTTVMPRSPVSYRGFLLQIRWAIVVRVTMVDGTEVVEEYPFALTARGDSPNSPTGA